MAPAKGRIRQSAHQRRCQLAVFVSRALTQRRTVRVTWEDHALAEERVCVGVVVARRAEWASQVALGDGGSNLLVVLERAEGGRLEIPLETVVKAEAV